MTLPLEIAAILTLTGITIWAAFSSVLVSATRSAFSTKRDNRLDVGLFAVTAAICAMSATLVALAG